jgi:hypothetical protein
MSDEIKGRSGEETEDPAAMERFGPPTQSLRLSMCTLRRIMW